MLPEQFQPVSIDLRLGAVSFKDGTEVDGRPLWRIEPHQFLLGSTLETVGVSENLVGMVHGKSTLAREGLIVEAAGLVDPGFTGELTLEMFNMTDAPIPLHRGMSICQLTLHWTDSTPDRMYGQADNHYQGQAGPTPSWRVAS